LDSQKTAFINGISGQDGAYLAEYLLSKNYKVAGITRNSSSKYFHGLVYLGINDDVEIIQADLSEAKQCNLLFKNNRIDEFYNLGAQSSVSYSFNYPTQTISYNVLSVLNLLEVIRGLNQEIKFYQASSSEMFGKIQTLPISKDSALHPVSPYGISKATGHWLVNQYREAYGLYAASGILFNHESYLRSDSFFVKKVIKSAIQIKRGGLDFLRVGNIDIKRDFGFAREYVKAIWLMLQLDQPEDFQVCSGTSISLRQIVHYVFDQFQLDHELIMQDVNLFRPAEIVDIYGDNAAIKAIGWTYDYSFFDILDILIEEELRNDGRE